MKKELALIRLECKRIFNISPSVGLQLMVLCAAVLFMAVFGPRLLNQDKLNGKIQVGILIQQDNSLTDFALELLWNMENMKSTCTFYRMESMQEAKDMDAVLVFPPGMVESILSGQNIPGTVYLYGKDGIRDILTRELLQSGISVLSSAQAQIYSAYLLLNQYGRTDRLEEVQNHVNLSNLNLALNHDRIWKTVRFGATGELSEEVHFLSSGTVLYLLLMGLNCCFLVSPDNRLLAGMLKRRGYTAAKQVIARILAVLLFLLGSFCVLLPILKICIRVMQKTAEFENIIIFDTSGMPGPGVLLQLLLLLLLASVMIVWALEMADSVSGMVLGLTLGSFVLLFISGGFYPSVFLPETLQKAGRLLPGQELIRLASGVFTAAPGKVSMGKITGYIGFFIITAIGAVEWKNRG